MLKRTMTVDEINKKTISRMNHANVVYRANKETFLFNPEKQKSYHINEGALACIGTCGAQLGEMDFYNYKGYWCVGKNDDWDHYANEIGYKVK